MKAKYTETQILPPSPNDELNTVIWSTVIYVNELESGQEESIKVNVLIADPNVPINQIEKVAIKRANELLKKAISENQ